MPRTSQRQAGRQRGASAPRHTAGRGAFPAPRVPPCGETHTGAGGHPRPPGCAHGRARAPRRVRVSHPCGGGRHHPAAQPAPTQRRLWRHRPGRGRESVVSGGRRVQPVSGADRRDLERHQPDADATRLGDQRLAAAADRRSRGGVAAHHGRRQISRPDAAADAAGQVSRASRTGRRGSAGCPTPSASIAAFEQGDKAHGLAR